MSKELPSESNKFESVLQAAISVPGVRINRESFLRKELTKYFDDEIIEMAISGNPAKAGISVKIINQIARSCIALESTKVTALSAAAGAPGGFAMIGTVPADLVQYFAHILRIMQKLAYLYGWQEFAGNDVDGDGMDDGLTNQLTLFVGVMFGVKAANTAVTKIAQAVAANVSGKIMKKALTKGAIYPLVKKIAKYMGVKMTKELFAKGVGKALPIVGAVASGAITAAGFIPMANRTKKYFSKLPLADPEHYKTDHSKDVIDLDFENIDTTEIDVQH